MRLMGWWDWFERNEITIALMISDTNGDCEINFPDFGLMATNWPVSNFFLESSRPFVL
jgi:hypothetical protein